MSLKNIGFDLGLGLEKNLLLVLGSNERVLTTTLLRTKIAANFSDCLTKNKSIALILAWSN